MCEKSRRSYNFNDIEVESLIALVEKYKSIIENKETDAVSWQEKNIAWDNLCLDFNALGIAHIRTAKQLREKWINIKKESKKKFSAEKIEIYKTGGGNKKHVFITHNDEKVKDIIGVAVTGKENNYDSDHYVQTDKDQINNPVDQLDSVANDTYELSTSNWSKWNPKTLRCPVTQKLTLEESNNHNQFGPSWSAMPFISEIKKKKENEKQFIQINSSPLSIIRNISNVNLKRINLKLINPNGVKAGTDENQVEETNSEETLPKLICQPTAATANENMLKRRPKPHQGETPKRKCLETDVNVASGSGSKSLKKKNQLTTDCRIKINTLSATKLELVEVQKECLYEEHLMKKEEHELKIMHAKAEHEIVMTKYKLEVELLKQKLKNSQE